MEIVGKPKTVFNDYHKTCLYVPTSKCTFKCVKEAKKKGIHINCQNHDLNKVQKVDVSAKEIKEYFIDNNPFIEALLLSGLDPMDDFDNVLFFLQEFREISDMEVVIFTGYYPHEIKDKLKTMKSKGLKDITFKFGRYDPTNSPAYDEIGKIELASGNQYFKRLKDFFKEDMNNNIIKESKKELITA